jgi:3-hydroxyisobutyrate dehydrogenase
MAGMHTHIASRVVKHGQYPTQFALSLQHKDLRLILSEADEVSVPMPATAVALQMYTAALTQGMDADFSIMIKFMEQLADVSQEEHLLMH